MQRSFRSPVTQFHAEFLALLSFVFLSLSTRAYFKGRAYIKIILKNHARSYCAGRSYYRENTVVAPDSTQWTKIVYGTHSRGRYLQQNILRKCSGATFYARRNVRINSPASAWRLIFDKFILEHIQSCTVTEAHLQTKCKDFTLTVEELEALIGIMYARGVTGKNDMPVTDLWSKTWGVAF